MTQPILHLQKIVKKFGGNIAVNNVDLTIFPGEIVALLGENGAGKSTLIKILAGIYERDSGDILFHQHKIQSAKTLRKGQHQPIAFIHQDLGLIEWMTVAENMAFSMGYPKTLGVINWRLVRKQAKDALLFVGLNLDVDTRVFDLSRTEKALLAIARAIAVNAEILVLDEPTASLPAADVEHLFSVLRNLKEKGVGMIYVTHRLDEVIALTDRILVMRDGSPVAEGKTKDYDVKKLCHAICGEETRQRQRLPLPTNNQEVLRLDNVIVDDIGPVSFSLQAGEMVALAGLRGAGQEEIGRLLFGERHLKSGHIQLNNRPFIAHSPQEAIKQGIALVAGDRVKESVIMSMTTTENLFLNPTLLGASPLKKYDRRKELAKAWFNIQLFDVRPKNLFIDISSLSGGNQQKIVMARWLALETPVLILEDPTAGVDIGARAEIYALLNNALKQGIAIIVISTDFEEIAHICNRAFVFNRGEIVAELKNDQVSFANILALASNSTPTTLS